MLTNLTRPILTLLLFDIFCESNAYAEVVPDPTPVQRVEVSGKTNVDLARISTTAKVVITQEEIAKFGDTNLADALKRIPGITVSGNTGRGGEVRMRGLGSGYTQILINGDAAPPGFSIDSLAPSLIERVEINRVATADQSAQAIAGSINIILKQVGRKAQRQLKIGAVDQSDRLSYYLDGLISDKRDNISYSLSAAIADEDFDLPASIAQQKIGSKGEPIFRRSTRKDIIEHGRKLDLVPNFKWTGKESQALTVESWLGLNYIENESHELHTTAFGARPQYARTELRQKIDIQGARAKLGWSQKLFEDADLDIKFGSRLGRTTGRARFLGFDESDQRVQDQDISSQADDKIYTINGKLHTELVDKHAITLGWDGDISQRNENRIQRTVAAPGYPNLNQDEVYDIRVKRLALFAQDEWDVAKLWSLYLGVRWEGLQTRIQGNTLASAENTSSVYSPIVQSKWKLSETGQSQVRFAASRTYRAPTIRDLNPRRFVASDNSPGTPDRQGNPNLLPELAWGLDLAYEYFLARDAGLLSCNAFIRRVDNVIIKQTSLVHGAWSASPINSGEAHLKGLELEGKLRLKKMRKEWHDVDLRANVAWNWSSIKNIPGPDNRLDNQRPFSANIGMDYNNPAWSFKGGVNYSFESSGRARQSEYQFSRLYTKRSLDIYGLWKMNADVQVRLTASNILAQDLVEESSYVDATGSFTQVSAVVKKPIIKIFFEIKL